MAEIAEKIFEYYLTLPEDVRAKVIDEMNAFDRCRMTRCSKLCNKEAKASKNFAYGVTLSRDGLSRGGRMTVKISISKETRLYYEFDTHFGKNMKSYFRDFYPLWEVELDSSVNLVQCALEEFRDRIKEYQNSIKVIGFYTDNHNELHEDFDFGIENLKNLEEMQIIGDIDVSQIIPKIQNPLKKMYIDLKGNSLPTNYEQIHQVSQELYCEDANFDNEQFQKLSAKKVIIPIGQLKEKDIFKFIRSWQDGTVGRDIEVYQWCYKHLDFDEEAFGFRLLKLLRIRNHENDEAEIKHYKQAGRTAKLLLNDWSLEFNTMLGDSE